MASFLRSSAFCLTSDLHTRLGGGGGVKCVCERGVVLLVLALVIACSTTPHPPHLLHQLCRLLLQQAGPADPFARLKHKNARGLGGCGAGHLFSAGEAEELLALHPTQPQVSSVRFAGAVAIGVVRCGDS